MNRRQRRRRAVTIRAGLIGPPTLVAVSWLVGLLLSPLHRERASATYRSSPETVWRVLTDLDGMPTWRRDLVTVERLPVAGGATRWREQGTTGQSAYQVVVAEPPVRLVVELVSTDDIHQVWEYRIRRLEAGGTELSVIEERSIRNPALRPVVKLFGSDRDRIEGLARDLADRLAGHRDRLAATLIR
jgi:uncharacterized protein YndB with AHSA1/START domain